MHFNEYGQCQLQVWKKKKKRISKQDSIRDENERYEQRNMTKQYRAMIRDYKRLRVPIINNDYDDDDNDCELWLLFIVIIDCEPKLMS